MIKLRLRHKWRVAKCAFVEYASISKVLRPLTGTKMAWCCNFTIAVSSLHYACLFVFSSLALQGMHWLHSIGPLELPSQALPAKEWRAWEGHGMRLLAPCTPFPQASVFHSSLWFPALALLCWYVLVAFWWPRYETMRPLMLLQHWGQIALFSMMDVCIPKHDWYLRNRC